MAARSDDKDKLKKLIIADHANGMSERQLARKYNTSNSTVHRWLKADPETEQLVAQKKAENTADVLAYMDSHKDKVCLFLGAGLEALNDPEKMQGASLTQIATTMGIIIDKWAMISGAPADAVKDDALSESLRSMADELQSDKAD